ncbi:hypothetical protein HP546_19030 [Pseudomonas sp. CM25]|uniref:hypothetical protein n=1 Tax=Pseudomonas sp. CM25 TaxID=2738448 RepID=UPI001554FF4A|nr:hypothetical protein [Pseudomonas sp. CM25]NQD57433.1 hypothetical protein [Pseudomonas sp. CM25]
MFDRSQILQLRNDAALAAIDTKRARIEPADDGGFVVIIGAPVVDISRLLETLPPSRVETRSAIEAEGQMLHALLTIQRKERQVVRSGIVGWTPEQITRRPLDPAELADYQAKVSHATKVAQLQRELSQAIDRRVRAEQDQRSADELAERYGLTQQSSPAASTPRRARAGVSK